MLPRQKSSLPSSVQNRQPGQQKPGWPEQTPIKRALFSSRSGNGEPQKRGIATEQKALVNLGLLSSTHAASTKTRHPDYFGRSTEANDERSSLRGTQDSRTSARDTQKTRARQAHRPPTSRSASSASHHDELGTMIDATGPRSRRERTFIGSECAACEEPLEHTLRGERILQLSCGHVSHEACFYEYIKEFESQNCPTCNAPLGLDTSRGGNIDFEKLNTLVRGNQTPDFRPREPSKSSNPWDSPKPSSYWSSPKPPGQWESPKPHNQWESPRQHGQWEPHKPSNQWEQQKQPSQWEQQKQSNHWEQQKQPNQWEQQKQSNHWEQQKQPNQWEQQKQPHHWDQENGRSGPRSIHSQHHSHSTNHGHQDQDYRNGGSVSSHGGRHRERYDSYGGESRQHARNDSGTTAGHSATDFAETQQQSGRRHDYDVQSMEMSVSSQRASARNPIPPPTVTVRSEFPTLTRSRQQQSLTCLVTVEVVDGKWRPDPEDIRAPPSAAAPSIAEESVAPPVKQRKQSNRPRDIPRESPEALQRVTQELNNKVENWHGLDFARFGKLLVYGAARVGKDRQSWQDLECYLFTEMLILIKEKKIPHQQQREQQQQQPWDSPHPSTRATKCTLKGSIIIRKHLKQVETFPEQNTLTLSLSVAELPHFHMLFKDPSMVDIWRRALVHIDDFATLEGDEELETSGTDEDDYANASKPGRRASSVQSSYGAAKSNYTAPTEYTNPVAEAQQRRLPASVHVPLDIVVVIPVTSSMQGLKISLLRDVLRFLVLSLGEQDRMGLVTFGSSGGGMPIVGMTSKTWHGWPMVLESIKPLGQKSLRADVVEGANVAMDLLMQRKSSNPLSSILLISDSTTSDSESVDFVVSRAEAAKITIHSFGLGLTHKPDTMIELSTRTKATYTYVKDWMMLRECVAGCLGSLQSTSHQNVKLKLRLPEGSTAKFVKINGALQIIKRATGRDAEASLGDLRFGDKRDILVQLAIAPDNSTPEQVSQDPWDTIVSGLEALGGPLEQDDMRTVSVEEIPLIQADLNWGDILREGSVSQLPRPSLLAITMLPASRKSSMAHPATPPIPPHPSVVQRRMELLTSDMLTRGLTLVSRGQADRANHLLTETRTILRGLGKGGLPPLPPPPTSRLPPTPTLNGNGSGGSSPTDPGNHSADGRRTPSPPRSESLNPFTPAAGIDSATISALDAEIVSALEWISHPAVFGRDSRKAVLQAIGVISSQRALTFRTPSEALWAIRIPGIKRLADRSKDWREAGDEALMKEES